MHVLYFHQHFTTPKGSSGIRSYKMARCLIDKGHRVTMVCGTLGAGNTGLNLPFHRGRRSGEVDGIHIIEFDLAYSNNDGFLKRTITFLQFAFRSVWLALTERYDVVFATTTPLTAGIPGIFARWLRCKPFVFEVRDLWPELPKAMGVIRSPLLLGALSVLEWCSYRSAHRCIGLSPGIVEGITRRGVAKDKIALIPNGCDLDIFSSEIRPWKPSAVKDGDLIAIFAGTHGLANGLDAVIEAAAVLKSRGVNNVKILLVGNGKLKTKLQQVALDRGLSSVIFLDPVDKLRLAGLFAASDLGMQILANIPSFYYGTSPNKFFDYIAAGLPVLNNYPGWLASLIKDHRCGYAVAADDPSAFADALEYAANHQDELKLMGRNARKLAEEKFNRKDLADEWVRWVEGVNS